MDDQRHAAAVTDEAVGDEIARALAVDPSPEFLARVRTQIANEPEHSLLAALKGCATFGTWRRALALRSSWLAAPVVVAVAIVLAIVVIRPDRSGTLSVNPPLAARAFPTVPTTPPYVGSGFSRTYNDQTVHSSLRAVGPPKGGPHVEVLLDPRETQALRALIAGVRTNRVDLSPLLRPGTPAPMELPPVDDLVIAPLAIEPLAPVDGAQGERQ